MRDLPDDFQLEQLDAGLCFVKKFNLAIDVGAHRGIWTRRMSERFDRVVAIEPTELSEKIKGERITVIKAACGSTAGKCSIARGLRNTGQSYIIDGESTDMITLDSLNLSPDFIKIDVEGMEFNAIKGAKTTILRDKPVVMLEENNLSERYGHYTGRAVALLRRWGMKPLATFHMYPDRDKNIVLGW